VKTTAKNDADNLKPEVRLGPASTAAIGKV